MLKVYNLILNQFYQQHQLRITQNLFEKRNLVFYEIIRFDNLLCSSFSLTAFAKLIRPLCFSIKGLGRKY